MGLRIVCSHDSFSVGRLILSREARLFTEQSCN